MRRTITLRRSLYRAPRLTIAILGAAAASLAIGCQDCPRDDGTSCTGTDDLPACTNGETRCSADRVQTCTEGAWQTTIDCSPQPCQESTGTAACRQGSSADPDIEVCYGHYCGPIPQNDCTDGVCNSSAPLDFGSISLGAVGTQTVTITNVAACAIPDGGDPCDFPELCRLTIAPSAEYFSIGLGFEPGTNADGRFALVENVAGPIEIEASGGDTDCGADPIMQLHLTYSAPPDAATDSAVLVIESNDLDEPVIKVPMVARAIAAQ